MTNTVLRAFALVLPLAVFCSGAAHAQSITIQKGALQQAEHHTSRRQIQIIDESPIVHDLRRAPQQDIYNVEIGPGPAAQAPRVFTIKSSGPGSLPFAGTTSNIPAGGMRPTSNLSPTTMGVMPKCAQPRAIGKSSPAMALAKATTIAKMSTPAEYAHTPPRDILHGDGGASGTAQPSVRAVLLPHKQP